MRFSDYFDRAAGLYPKSEAFIDGDERIDFQTARASIHKIANVLSGTLGLPEGSKVAVYSPNATIGYLSIVGVNRADMVWVPINYRNSLPDTMQVLEFFDTDCLLIHSVFAHQIADIQSKVPSIKSVVCIDSDAHGVPSLVDMMKDAEPVFEYGPEDPLALSVIAPTGGTTGPSKGVMQTHRGIESSLMHMHDLEIPEQPRHLVVAPITHAAGYLIPAFFSRGGANIILPGFDAENVLKTIEREKITHMFLPPTAIYALLDSPKLKDYDCSSLQGFYCGSAPIAPQRFKEAVGVFGTCMTEQYGQTETYFPTLLKTSKDYLDADGNFRDDVLASSGRATRATWIEIMDDDGNILPAGEKGEIVVRASSVMAGYYKNPEATAEVSQFGWHHTTDMGIRNEEGYVTIVDRKKDMIITGGFNVFPVEVETVLHSHPAIRNSAVIGVPDPKWGEAIKAVVELNDGKQIDEQELIAFCKEALGSVKAPKSIDFWDELPLSPVGKVLKRQIRDTYWKGQARAV